MVDLIKIGYLGPDFSKEVSRHVIAKGGLSFATALGKQPGISMERIVSFEQIERVDALLMFHHTTAGFYLYENPIYTAIIKKLLPVLDQIRKPKFLWHVEPAPIFGSTSVAQVENSDVILTSSALSMFEGKRTIYVPNGVDLGSFVKWNKTIKTKDCSAPMNLRFMDLLGRNNVEHESSRLNMLRRLAWDRKVDVYGEGWKKHRKLLSPNWTLYNQSPDEGPFLDYKYVMEVVEEVHLENLNEIGYCSDRISWALAHGCHLVTNLKWMKKAYKSVIGWDELSTHQYNPIALRMDAKAYSWDNIAKSRVEAIRTYYHVLMQTKYIQHQSQKFQVNGNQGSHA